MQSRLAELIEYMDAARARLFETARAINPAFASIRPRGDTWSVEDNMSHLAAVEEGVARLVAKSVAWAKAKGVGPETSSESMLTSLDRFGLAAAKFKMQSPAMVAPPPGKSIDESISALEGSRNRMKDALISADGMDLSQVKRPHPALGELDLYQWALFVAQHEERHRQQIENTLDEVTELAAESAPIV